MDYIIVPIIWIVLIVLLIAFIDELSIRLR